AELLVTLRGRERRGLVRTFARNALLCVTIHALFLLWSMADSPQLYASHWYARGGVHRTVQIVATDLLGPNGVIRLAVVRSFLCARPRGLVRRARRALGLVRRFYGVGGDAVARQTSGLGFVWVVLALAGPDQTGASGASGASGAPPAMPASQDRSLLS